MTMNAAAVSRTAEFEELFRIIKKKPLRRRQKGIVGSRGLIWGKFESRVRLAAGDTRWKLAGWDGD